MKNIFLICALFFSSILLLTSCNNKNSNDQASEATVADSANEEKAVDDSHNSIPTGIEQKNIKSDITADTIIGRWLRPDGNYVIQINSIDKDNHIDAQYFNPKPIKIARAELMPDNNFRIFIEFDDEGYKGSSYDLVYDPTNDVLSGKYFQATYGQTYQIGFVRMKD